MTTPDSNPAHSMCPSCRNSRAVYQGAYRSAYRPEDLNAVIIGDTPSHWRLLSCGRIYEHAIFEVYVRDVIIPNTNSTTGPNNGQRNPAQVFSPASRAAAFAMWFHEFPGTIYSAPDVNVGIFGVWDIRVVR